MKRIMIVATWLAFVLSGLAGCQHLPVGFNLEPPHQADLVAYADRLAQQAAADERTQALEQARQAFEQSATPMTHARLGLALGQPGFKGYAPNAARQHLKTALSAKTANWTPIERAFLSLRLQQIQSHANQRAQWQSRLHAAQHKQEKLAREARHLRQRLENISHRLQAALQKLQAITEIEQNLGLRKYNQ